MNIIRKMLLLLLSLGALNCDVIPEEDSGAQDPPSPVEMLLEINDDRRFVSVDWVADRIINQDPAMKLIDVRPHPEFDAFALPGAINIPLASLTDEESRIQLDGSRYSIVFYSNSTLSAEQAWQLTRRWGCANVRVMKGGLNEWAEKILTPQKPAPTASAAEFEVYQQRKAASMYFIGASQALTPEPFVQPVIMRPEAPKTITPKPKKKKVEEEEGC